MDNIPVITPTRGINEISHNIRLVRANHDLGKAVFFIEKEKK